MPLNSLSLHKNEKDNVIYIRNYTKIAIIIQLVTVKEKKFTHNLGRIFRIPYLFLQRPTQVRSIKTDANPQKNSWSHKSTPWRKLQKTALCCWGQCWGSGSFWCGNFLRDSDHINHFKSVSGHIRIRNNFFLSSFFSKLYR